MILFCCNCSGHTFKERSSESTTPRTTFVQHDNDYPNISIMSRGAFVGKKTKYLPWISPAELKFE